MVKKEIDKNNSKPTNGKSKNLTVLNKSTQKEKKNNAKGTTKLSSDSHDFQNNNHYKFLFEQSPIGIFYFDNEYKVTDCNSFLVNALRSKRSDLIGLDLRTIKDKSILNAITESLHGSSGTYEGVYRSNSTEAVVFASLKTFALTDDEGKIIGGVGLAEDITEKKKTEEALKLSENRYKILSNLTTDAASILTIEADGTFNRKWLNDDLLIKTGFKVHEIDTFEKWAKIVHPEDLNAYYSSVKEIISGKKVSRDFRIINKDGSIIWINNTVYPEQNSEGKVVGLISAIKDITQKVIAEQELLRQKNLLDLIINNAPIGIWVTASDGSYPIINKSFRDSVGYDSGVLSIKPEELESCQKSDLLAYQSNEQINTEEEITFVDGKKHILQILKTQLKAHDGSNIGILGIGNDITEHKLYEEQLKLAITKAEEVDKLKSAFLANMSHEIRTPLNGIIGFSKYLKDYPATEEEYHHILDIICNSADHLLKIINDIIDISKLDSGQVKINPVSCNLNKLLNGVYSFFYSDFLLMMLELNKY